MKVPAVILVVVAGVWAKLESQVEFLESEYVIVSNDKTTWYNAASYCKSRGMDICSIDTQPEFEFIVGEIFARSLQNEHIWIGGTEIGQEDNYFWVNSGQPIALNNWDPDEIPDTKNKCMVFYKGLWRHSECTDANYYICEKLISN